jgi:hypothetical protein
MSMKPMKPKRATTRDELGTTQQQFIAAPEGFSE